MSRVGDEPRLLQSRTTLTSSTWGCMQSCQNLLLDTPKYAVMLAGESKRTRDPSTGDRVRVALVDLTGDKICKPGYADWGSTIPITGGSTVKIAMVYAAHQLLFDLNELARARQPQDRRRSEERRLIDVWSQLICKPDLDWLVEIRRRGRPPRESQASAESQDTFEADGRRDVLCSQRGARQPANHPSRLRVHRICAVAVRAAPFTVPWIVGEEHLPAGEDIGAGATRSATTRHVTRRLMESGNEYMWYSDPTGRYRVPV